VNLIHFHLEWGKSCRSRMRLEWMGKNYLVHYGKESGEGKFSISPIPFLAYCQFGRLTFATQLWYQLSTVVVWFVIYYFRPSILVGWLVGQAK
jgi:hypothetical protein